MNRAGLMGLAWNWDIMDLTMELVRTNGPHRSDGLITPTMEHFKSNRDTAL